MANYWVTRPFIPASKTARMIVGDRKRGAFIVALAVTLLFLTFGFVIWFREHRTNTPPTPKHAGIGSQSVRPGILGSTRPVSHGNAVKT